MFDMICTSASLPGKCYVGINGINASHFPLDVLIAREMIQIWFLKKVCLLSSLKVIVL